MKRGEESTGVKVSLEGPGKGTGRPVRSRRCAVPGKESPAGRRSTKRGSTERV